MQRKDLSPLLRGIFLSGIISFTINFSFGQPSWSRGEVRSALSYEQAMEQAEHALTAEGYSKLQKQATFVAGYKQENTALIIIHESPGNKQWVNFVVTNNGSSSPPDEERKKIQQYFSSSSDKSSVESMGEGKPSNTGTITTSSSSSQTTNNPGKDNNPYPPLFDTRPPNADANPISSSTSQSSTTITKYSPSWSKGEQQLPMSFEIALIKAETALKSEGYESIQTKGNLVAGFKNENTALIICNNAPGNTEWVDVMVFNLGSHPDIPGTEREKLQKQISSNTVILEGTKGIDWYANPANMGLRGKNNQRFTYTCPAMDMTGYPLFGTGIYSDNSSICSAGVHAGAITASGGVMTIEILPGQDSYKGSNSYGVRSDDLEDWPGSFKIVK